MSREWAPHERHTQIDDWQGVCDEWGGCQQQSERKKKVVSKHAWIGWSRKFPHFGDSRQRLLVGLASHEERPTVINYSRQWHALDFSNRIVSDVTGVITNKSGLFVTNWLLISSFRHVVFMVDFLSSEPVFLNFLFVSAMLSPTLVEQKCYRCTLFHVQIVQRERCHYFPGLGYDV